MGVVTVVVSGVEVVGDVVFHLLRDLLEQAAGELVVDGIGGEVVLGSVGPRWGFNEFPLEICRVNYGRSASFSAAEVLDVVSGVFECG